MKTGKNEKGYALLMVLMLILLFTVLGMGLMATNMNSAKQFNMKEEQVKARHQAEMGLLHYQAEVKKTVDNYTFTKFKGEGEAEAIKRSRLDLCQQLAAIELPSRTVADGSYSIKNRTFDGCAASGYNEISISLLSTGKSDHQLEKMVEGTIELAPPKINFNDDMPVKPVKPVPPAENDATIFLEIEGPHILKKINEEYGTLIINEIPSEEVTKKDKGSIVFQGGKGETLTVGKDLYIDGDIFSQNHSCIYVRGDMTVTGKIIFNTQSSIIVLGNAYFKGIIDLQNNANIYVAGNTYVGANKDLINLYNDANAYKDYCGNLPHWPETEPAKYRWKTKDELNPYYH